MNSITSAAAIDNSVLSQRVLELRKKIHDADYVNYAVQRIAQVISLRLVDGAADPFAKN